MRSLSPMFVLAAALSPQEPDRGAQLAGLIAQQGGRERAAAVRALTKELPDVAAWQQAIAAWLPPVAEPGRRMVDVAVEPDRSLQVQVFVPPEHPAGAPLILYLHGSGGTAGEAMALWQGIATDAGACIVAPQASGTEMGHVYSPASRADVLEVLRWACANLPVDPQRVLLTGVSRGGHLSWDLALRHPDRFAALAPMIGAPRMLPREGQHNLRLLENLVATPIRDLQGEKDDPLLLANLRFAFAELARLGAPDAKLVTFPDLGHGYEFGAVDWKEMLGTARRAARPEVVTLRTARLDEARSGWVEILAFEKHVQEDFAIRVSGDFNALAPIEQVRAVTKAGEASVARIRARMTARGAFMVESKGVREFRLLLDETMFEPGKPVSVRWNGKTKSLRVSPSAATLLADWADRMDRGFLPVAEVVVR